MLQLNDIELFAEPLFGLGLDSIGAVFTSVVVLSSLYELLHILSVSFHAHALKKYWVPKSKFVALNLLPVSLHK